MSTTEYAKKGKLQERVRNILIQKYNISKPDANKLAPEILTNAFLTYDMEKKVPLLKRIFMNK